MLSHFMFHLRVKHRDSSLQVARLSCYGSQVNTAPCDVGAAIDVSLESASWQFLVDVINDISIDIMQVAEVCCGRHAMLQQG